MRAIVAGRSMEGWIGGSRDGSEWGREITFNALPLVTLRSTDGKMSGSWATHGSLAGGVKLVEQI